MTCFIDLTCLNAILTITQFEHGWFDRGMFAEDGVWRNMYLKNRSYVKEKKSSHFHTGSYR